MKNKEFAKLLLKLEEIKLKNQERESKRLKERKIEGIEEFVDKSGDE